MNTTVVQKIIDHWHIGQLITFTQKPGYLKIKTGQGLFYVLEISRQQWLENSSEELAKEFSKSHPEQDRLADPPFCHVSGYYYCTFKVI